jgi:hypothetical protein
MDGVVAQLARKGRGKLLEGEEGVRLVKIGLYRVKGMC